MSAPRRNGPMQHLGDVLGGPAWVWEAKARAEAARDRAEAPAPPEAPARSQEAEAMVLALLAKYGSAPDRAEPERKRHIASVPIKQAPAPRVPAPTPAPLPAPPTNFARSDDQLPADATWLQMELSRVPTLHRADFRAGREAHTRLAWRRALAATMQRSPGQLASPGGALIMQVRKATATGAEPRTADTYCAAVGWGPHAYAIAGVEGYIHLDYDCRCTD